MSKTITSVQNIEIKNLLLLQEKARTRKKMGLFVVEGIREIQLGLQSGYILESIYIQKEIMNGNSTKLLENLSVSQTYISKEVYQKIAYRNSTEGVIAIFKTKELKLSDLVFKNKKPLILVVESIEKPGNIGALLRTADAAGIDAVIIAEAQTDFYNPNVFRSSIGCAFTVPVALADNQDILDFLNHHDFNIFGAALTYDAENYLIQNYTEATAIVLGTESKGLSTFWLENTLKNIIIPMRGKIDSMNISVAAAVVVFEAVRQRY